MGWPGPLTHRQFLVELAWLGLQWDRPSRSDVYQMQTAAEAKKCWVAKPNEVRLQDMLIPFGKGAKEAAPEVTLEEAAAESKARWGARLGVRRGPGAEG